MMSAPIYYRLHDREPLPCSREEWSIMFSDVINRRVGLDRLPNGFGSSTVFVGMDQRFSGVGPPLLFETIVWDADGEVVDVERCSTWGQAVAQHEAAIERHSGQEAG